MTAKIIRLKTRVSWLEAVGYAILGAEIGVAVGQWLNQREAKRINKGKREVA